MPRRRNPQSPPVVYRTARAGLRLTRARRRRLIALLVAAGDLWACILELNAWRRRGQDRPVGAGLPAAAGPPGPGPALPGRAGPLGHPAVRRGPTVGRRDRRGPGRRLP